MSIKHTISKHSPQIFMAAGILGFVSAAVVAVMKADKIKPIIDETKDNVKAATIDDRRFGFKTKGDEILYKTTIVTKAVAKVSKEMAVPIGLATLSTGCLLKSYNIMSDRQLALVSTIDILKTGKDVYRKAVLDEVGEETTKKIDEKVIVKQITDHLEKAHRNNSNTVNADADTFSRYFCKETSNKYPKEGADTVLPFLKAAETYFNQLLHSRECLGRPGVVRFNEVLDYLGFQKIPEGETSGWISYGGKGFVDFGIIGAYYADYDGLLDRYNCIIDTNKIPRSNSGYMLCFNINPCIIK